MSKRIGDKDITDTTIIKNDSLYQLMKEYKNVYTKWFWRDKIKKKINCPCSTYIYSSYYSRMILGDAIYNLRYLHLYEPNYNGPPLIFLGHFLLVCLISLVFYSIDMFIQLILTFYCGYSPLHEIQAPAIG